MPQRNRFHWLLRLLTVNTVLSAILVTCIAMPRILVASDTKPAATQDTAPFFEYRRTGAQVVKRSVVTIAQDGKTRAQYVDHNPATDDVDHRMALTQAELAYMRTLIRSGRFFEQKDSSAVAGFGHGGVVRLHAVLGDRDHSIRFGMNRDLAPLLQFVYRIEMQAVTMQRLESDQNIYSATSSISPHLSGSDVLRPEAFVEPLKRYIVDCQDFGKLEWTVTALAQLVSRFEFAGYLAQQMEQADTERDMLLAQLITSHPFTENIPADHLKALRPLFVKIQTTIGAETERTQKQKSIASRLDKLLRK